MSGFDNDIVFAKNADFTQVDNQAVSENNGLVLNGKFWIGSTVANAGGTHINVGSIVSPLGTLNIGYLSPNITLDVAGGSISNVLTANATAQFTGTSTKTIDFALTNLILGSSAVSITTANSNVGFGTAVLDALTSGSQNTGVGFHSLISLQDGAANTAIGIASLGSLLSGLSNTACGQNALTSVQTGSNNCAFGAISMQGVTSSDNTAFGYATANQLVDGTRNAVVGWGALGNCVSGNDNTTIGYNSGFDYTINDSNNICIGSNVIGVTGNSNEIRIGNDDNSTCFITGINGATVTGTAVLCAADGQLGTVVSSERYKENIVDMPDDVSVLNLRPVQFNYKGYPIDLKYGLIAEEVARDFPYLCFYKKGQPESVIYHELCTFLLVEIQRLEKRITKLEN